jgi:hypothetical protein
MPDQLTKDDLVLLMESYRNMIIMHQTILDQTNKTIDKLNGMSEKQDFIFSKQNNLYDTLKNIVEKVNNSSLELKSNNEKTEELRSNVVEKLNSHELKSAEDHSKLTNKIYIGWIGMISIILALMGLGLTLLDLIKNIPIVK